MTQSVLYTHTLLRLLTLKMAQGCHRPVMRLAGSLPDVLRTSVPAAGSL